MKTRRLSRSGVRARLSEAGPPPSEDEHVANDPGVDRLGSGRTYAPFVDLQDAVAGRFSIERELGRGGMAIVYLARDITLDRLVAIKLLRPELAAQHTFKARFLREARIAAGLSHPNIVPIYLVEERRELIYYVMAFVAGESLADVVKRSGPLPVDDVIRWLQQIAWALGYAHGRGVVHRDVKPENVLIERGTDRVVVTDFGIAHTGKGTGLTEVGELIGSSHFVSPEQASGEVVSPASDIYSLGVTAFYMLTGRLLFDAPSDRQILAMHVTQSPESVAAARPGIPWVLAQIVDRCLNKAPEARFTSGDLLALELEDVQRHQLKVAPEVRAFERIASVTGERLAALLPVSGIVVFALAALEGFGATQLVLMLWIIWIVIIELIRQPIRLVRAARDVLRAGISFGEFQEILRISAYERLHRTKKPGSDSWRHRLIVGAVGMLMGLVPLLFLLIAPGWIEGHVLGLRSLSVTGFLIGVGFLATAFLSSWGSGTGGAWLRQTVWTGVLGRVVFRLAKHGSLETGSTSLPSPRDAEHVLGDAAVALLGELTPDVREKLTMVPSTLRRLEEEASELRVRRRAVDKALLEVREIKPRKPGKNEALRSRQRATRNELLEARRNLTDQIGNVVAKMESIRLELIRLRAGTGSVPALIQAAAAGSPEEPQD